MINIRRAEKEDIDTLLKLIKGIAQYHDQEQYVLTSKAEMLKSGFGEGEKFGALLAEFGGEIAGYVSYTWNYSIWLGGDFMNVDDLFVWEKFRGKNIGEALMLKTKEFCKAKGVARISWEVEEDNVGAIKFYKRLGAELQVKGKFKWEVK